MDHVDGRANSQVLNMYKARPLTHAWSEPSYIAACRKTFLSIDSSGVLEFSACDKQTCSDKALLALNTIHTDLHQVLRIGSQRASIAEIKMGSEELCIMAHVLDSVYGAD